MTDRHKQLQDKWKSKKIQKKWSKDLGTPKVLVKKGTQIIEEDTYIKKKIDVIIVSVDYNDLLVVTLSHNCKIFNNITVVTSSSDLLCQKICDKFNVKCVTTDKMYDDNSKFNKGKAINEGIRSLVDPDFILLIDADIIVSEKIDISTLERNYLYTSSRYICKSYNLLNSFLNNEKTLEDITTYESEKGLGFFQLFNINNESLDKDKVYPEFSSDASWDDLVFRDKFPNRKLINNKIIHLGHPYVNWEGRKSKRFLTDDEIFEIISRKSTYTICTYYFNYNNDTRQKLNFQKFLEQFNQNQLEKVIVGLPKSEKLDFEIDCKTVKVNVSDKIWSKETIINKIISEIETDYILWIDGDIIYENLEWLDNLDNIVGGNDFVQLFEAIDYLGEDGQILETHKSLFSTEITEIDKLLGKGYRPGGAWLGKTKILKDKPLFDKMHVGGGDTIFTYGVLGIQDGWTLNKVKEGSEDVYNYAKEWILNFGTYKVSYLSEKVKHLYHGDLSERNYNERYKKLKLYGPKIIIFTENIGDYDNLSPIPNFENTRCIAFLDKDIQIDGWEVVNINEIEEIKRIKNKKLIVKYIRTHSKELLPEHDYSIHIDANMILTKDPNIIIEEIVNKDHVIMAFNHYMRNSVYEEGQQCIEWNLDNHKKIENQLKKYKDEGLDSGLYECGFMLRKNDERVFEFDKIWWNEILNHSHRDQISFPYAIKKSGVSFLPFKDKNRLKSSYLTIKKISNGKTHKGDRTFNNNIIFLYEDSRLKWGSTKMRGLDISNKINCEMMPLSQSFDIKYKKIIILKLVSYEKILSLTEFNEIVIDMVDFNPNIHNLEIFKNFDYGIFTSNEQMKLFSNYFKFPEKCKVIYHHWDDRMNKVIIKNIESPKICYFGQPEKCYLYNKYTNLIDYNTIDWYDFDDKLQMYSDYNVHFAVKPKEEEEKIQPSTKISTAASLGCPVIVNKSNQNIEILGEDYPYYCEPTTSSVEKVIDKVVKTFNKKDWKKALDKLKHVKELTCIDEISKKYLDI